jgi:hypothetical protein
MFCPECDRLSTTSYKTTGKITILYVIICTYLGSRQEERFYTKCLQAFPTFNLLDIFVNAISNAIYNFTQAPPKFNKR